MPVIKALPALEVILGLKGVLDFYYWRGIPCVRKWPVIPPSSRTPASLASAALFGEIIRGYALLGPTVKALFQEAAADQPRTARDIYVSAVLGRLHEVDVATDNQLLVLIEAHTLALTALANALQSVATDQLLVRGQDQLFSIDEILALRKAVTATYNNYMVASDPVPAGKYWIITQVHMMNTTRTTSRHTRYIRRSSVSLEFDRQVAAFPAYTPTNWQGLIYLDAGASIWTEFTGSQTGDGLHQILFGYQMSLEA